MQDKWDNNMSKLFGCLGVILLIVVLIALGGFVIAWAWNGTMPYIFGLPEIDAVQGWMLILLGFIVRSSPSTVQNAWNR